MQPTRETPDSAPTIALLPWGDVYEDFLDMIGMSVEVFCREMRGGWLFNYVDALRLSGVRSIIVIVSARASKPSRVQHPPTGTTICILPAPKIYRAVRAMLGWIQNRLRRNGQEAARSFPGERRVLGPLSRVLREIAPYLATPLVPLARELRREVCGVILCQEYEYPRFDACVLLGRLMRIPVFASFQGGDFRLGSLEQLVRAPAIRASAGLIIGSRVEVERVRARYHVPITKIAYIFNPFDLSDWGDADRASARTELGIPDSARVAVWHGRVSIRPKGLDVLLDAWRRVVAARPGAALRLVLIGTGSEAPQLHQKIDAQRIEGIVWIDRYVLDRALLRQYLAAATRHPPAIAPTTRYGSTPDRTASGRGVSGGSCERSCSHAKNLTKGRRRWVA